MLGSRTQASVFLLLITVASNAAAQAPAPTSFWRFFGFPQGFNVVRDTVTNRRGNHPRLERRDPVKRLADPANLASDNPAIKAAAEIKQAEDMKPQKIKAIKYLAKIGCGCYDKDGKITDALLAAMDDPTPDVRVAAIEAVEDAAGDECCRRCGSTSCCSEKITKRLSEIAYERDDTGCPLEPNADVREAAARALQVCCPGRITGPIEEELEEVPTPPADDIPGEREKKDPDIQGESTGEETQANEAGLLFNLQAAQRTSFQHEFEMIEDPNGRSQRTNNAAQSVMDKPTSYRIQSGVSQQLRPQTVEPVHVHSLAPVNRIPLPTPTETAPINSPTPVNRVPLPVSDDSAAVPAPSASQAQSKPAEKIIASIVAVDHRSGQVWLRGSELNRKDLGSSGSIHRKRANEVVTVGHLVLKEIGDQAARAQLVDRAMVKQIQLGDQAVFQ